MQIKPRSRWLYVGSGDGKGFVQTVTGFFAPNEIATWSAPVRRTAPGPEVYNAASLSDEAPAQSNLDAIGGFAWLGPVEQFLIQFQFVDDGAAQPKTS